MLPIDDARRLVRQIAGAHTACPIELIPGESLPRLVGSSGHYVNPRGRIVHNRYRYERAGGTCEYVSSTLHVTVGETWFEWIRDGLMCDVQNDAPIPSFAREIEVGAPRRRRFAGAQRVLRRDII